MKKRKSSRSAVVLICCILAVPTVPGLMYNGAILNDIELMKPYLLTGLALGLVHLLLRPVLRIITAPLGCLTFGLSGMAIDVGLIYLAAGWMDMIAPPDFLCALLTAVVINVVCTLFAR